MADNSEFIDDDHDTLDFNKVFKVVGIVDATSDDAVGIEVKTLNVKHLKTNQLFRAKKYTFASVDDGNDTLIELLKWKKLTHPNVISIEYLFKDDVAIKDPETGASIISSNVIVVTKHFKDTFTDYLFKQETQNLKISDEEKKAAKVIGVDSVTVAQSGAAAIAASQKGLKSGKKLDDERLQDDAWTDQLFIPEEAVVNIMFQLSEGLAFLHSHDFVHGFGQLRTDSIFCSDFFSKFLIIIGRSNRIGAQLSRLGEILAYVAPEFRDFHVDDNDMYRKAQDSVSTLSKNNNSKAGDMWALGIIFYQLLTLFDENTTLTNFKDTKTMFQHLKKDVDRIKPYYSWRIIKYINNLLSLKPKDRYTAAELHVKFANLKKKYEKKAPPASPLNNGHSNNSSAAATTPELTKKPSGVFSLFGKSKSSGSTPQVTAATTGAPHSNNSKPKDNAVQSVAVLPTSRSNDSLSGAAAASASSASAPYGTVIESPRSSPPPVENNSNSSAALEEWKSKCEQLTREVAELQLEKQAWLKEREALLAKIDAVLLQQQQQLENQQEQLRMILLMQKLHFQQHNSTAEPVVAAVEADSSSTITTTLNTSTSE